MMRILCSTYFSINPIQKVHKLESPAKHQAKPATMLDMHDMLVNVHKSVT